MCTTSVKQVSREHYQSVAWMLAIVCLASLYPAAAQDVEFGFAAGMSGGSGSGSAIAVDGTGNVYTTGRFGGTVDFDPGADPAIFNLTSAGSLEIFVSKLDSSGNFVWAKAMGSTGADAGVGIALDGTGNVYVAGLFEGTVDFDPGAGVFNLTSAGLRDISVSKFDASGNFLWAMALGGAGNDEGVGMAVDGSGNVYTTGIFEGTADFDPGVGTANLTSAGATDIFVSKLDSDGNFVWAKAMGGTGPQIGDAIAVDNSGNVYTTGRFRETVDFDPGAGPAIFNLTSAGNYDIFVSKLDSSGNFVWAKAMGSTGADSGLGIAVDGTGNVYTTGSFAGTVDFDPGADPAVFNLTSAGSIDLFVNKLDSAGSFVWAKAMGSTSGIQGTGIAVNGSGNVYTTGLFAGAVDFDPGPGTAILTSAGPNDIFVSKLDSAGSFEWAQAMGGSVSDQGFGIAVDSLGNVHTTGFYTGTADFDPGAGIANLTDGGIFVSKLVVPPTVSSIVRADSNPTNEPSVDFTVTFSASVTGVDSDDFAIDATGISGASITDVTGSGNSYSVTVDTGTGDGTLSIDLSDDDSIIDGFSLPLDGIGANNGDFTAGEAYTVERTPPTLPAADRWALGSLALLLLIVGYNIVAHRSSLGRNKQEGVDKP